jgi:hypothetical protein
MLRRKHASEFEVLQNKKQAGFISRYMSIDNCRVLEVGAGAGAFLEFLHSEYHCEVFFDEHSKEAREIMLSKGVLNDFNDAAHSKPIDLVVLRHVLEHIFDLSTFMTYVRNVSSLDGYVFIEVPDWSNLDSRTDPLIFEHLNQFNTYSLVVLLTRLGWQIEALEKRIDPDDPATPNRVQRLLIKKSFQSELGSKNIVSEFKHFASINYDGWKSRLNQLVDDLAPNASIGLYPASHLTFEAMLESKLLTRNIIGMFDIDRKKWGGEFLQIKIFPPEDLKLLSPDLIVVLTMGYEQEIINSLTEMGLSSRIVTISQLVKESW